MQGRAEFVAHAGQKFAFKAIGLFHFKIVCFQLGILGRQFRRVLLPHHAEPFFRLPAVADVAHDRDDTQTVRRPVWTQADLHGKMRAVPAQCIELEASPHGAGLRLIRVRGSVAMVSAAHCLGNQTVNIQPKHFLARVAKHFFR